jgi:hypothetical protein
MNIMFRFLKRDDASEWSGKQSRISRIRLGQAGTAGSADCSAFGTDSAPSHRARALQFELGGASSRAPRDG